MTELVFYGGSFLLIFLGLFIALMKKNLIKIILGLSVAETGVNLLLISIGYIKGKTAPIFSVKGLTPQSMVDPVPQALVLTAIVIGVAVTALALSITVRLYKKHKTLDVRKLKNLKW